LHLLFLYHLLVALTLLFAVEVAVGDVDIENVQLVTDIKDQEARTQEGATNYISDEESALVCQVLADLLLDVVSLADGIVDDLRNLCHARGRDDNGIDQQKEVVLIGVGNVLVRAQLKVLHLTNFVDADWDELVVKQNEDDRPDLVHHGGIHSAVFAQVLLHEVSNSGSLCNERNRRHTDDNHQEKDQKHQKREDIVAKEVVCFTKHGPDDVSWIWRVSHFPVLHSFEFKDRVRWFVPMTFLCLLTFILIKIL
jgi:hypothetical protein